MSSEDLINSYPDSVGMSLNDVNMDTNIIYVCNICFRQYTLLEDLRGHFIEYHKCTPKVAERPLKEGNSFAPINKNCQTVETEESDDLQNLQIETEKEKVVKLEIRPMPFKSFRIVLRSKMIKGCPVTNSCPYKFENESKLSLHTKCHTSPNAVQKFKCYECNVELTNWRRCTAHLWKAHQIDVDLLQCPQCEYKAHASVLVWRHMRAHKKWRLRVLRSLRAVQRKRLQQDLKHTDVNAVPAAPVNKNKYYAEKTCEICNRNFVNGKTLSKHVKAVHNKIKPFICNVCGKKMARKASLIIHMRQHTGEKPLHCKICKFSTRDPSVLHKHQLRHEKAEKLKCKHCDFFCIQTSAYKRHMRLNHLEEYKKIACDLCNYVTISCERLQAHKSDHKKGLIVNHEDSMDATRTGSSKNLHKLRNKNEMSADCFLPIESIDSLPHEPAVDTGGVTIPAPSEDTQFPTYLNN
ncbi:zinc finger protein 91 isoform X1 [Zeugodacus cucurbitae]|uniref:Zinc finger and BTB domain-containing protein 16 n=2 Tax=Zeugodacus cucurbitae TaxID=28588 RepID=A0A0A1XQM1_ZEUCU|nr:zinc finger protein 91 isoform X1 [Zeugodacus cucurbitae]